MHSYSDRGKTTRKKNQKEKHTPTFFPHSHPSEDVTLRYYSITNSAVTSYFFNEAPFADTILPDLPPLGDLELPLPPS